MREHRTQNTEHRPNLSLSVKRSVSIAVCLLSVLTVLLTGCRPRGILHSGEMRSVLKDLHKADAAMQVSGFKRGDQEKRNIYYAQVLEKHHITQAQFDSSIVWYTAHPQLFDKIYPKVMADLAAEEEQFRALHAAELNTPTKTLKERLLEEERRFSQATTDSIIWVMMHGFPTPWEPYHKPFRIYEAD